MNLFTLLLEFFILLVFGVLIYAAIKGQSFSETWGQIKEMISPSEEE